MSTAVPDWIDPMMRAGYGARAIVYVVLGGLTVATAFYGGSTEGTHSALSTLKSEPFGVALLYIIAAGLLCYAVWRWTAAAYDLERRGDDTEGMAKRLALAVTGLTHAALGVSVALLAMSGGGADGGSSASDWTATVLSWPGGRLIVVLVGIAIAGAGAHYVLKGIERKYERYIQVTSTTRSLDPVMRAGFIAYGVVLAVVGAFIIFAGIQADPSEAKGIGAALEFIRSQPYGTFLLGAVGLGLIGFAVENMIEAAYRIVPRKDAGKVKTLAEALDHST